MGKSINPKVHSFDATFEYNKNSFYRIDDSASKLDISFPLHYRVFMTYYREFPGLLQQEQYWRSCRIFNIIDYTA